MGTPPFLTILIPLLIYIALVAFQLQLLQKGLAFHIGTRAKFARAIARIHGTGKRWRS